MMRTDILAYALEGLLADRWLTNPERVALANSMLEACTTPMPVKVPAELSHTAERIATKGIDACVADIIKALNNSGIDTLGCCCGHGRIPGSILLADGRELSVIFPSSWTLAPNTTIEVSE